MKLHTRPFEPVDPAEKARSRSSDNSNGLSKHAPTFGWTAAGITCRTSSISAGRRAKRFARNVDMTILPNVIMVRFLPCEGLSPSFFFFFTVTCMISGLTVTVTRCYRHHRLRRTRSVNRLRARCQHLPAVRGRAPACVVVLREFSLLLAARSAPILTRKPTSQKISALIAP